MQGQVYQLPLSEEEWRPVVGFEGWYEVSDLGRVRRAASGPHTRVGYVLKPVRLPSGRLMLHLSAGGRRYRNRKIHHLVALAFIGPRPPGCGINHVDGDVTNNRATNLEWVTQRENEDHAVRNGLKASGDRVGTAKLTQEQVIGIARSYVRGVTSQKELAARNDIAQTTVSRIIRGDHYHLR
jgi:hypothetical protein